MLFRVKHRHPITISRARTASVKWSGLIRRSWPKFTSQSGPARNRRLCHQTHQPPLARFPFSRRGSPFLGETRGETRTTCQQRVNCKFRDFVN